MLTLDDLLRRTMARRPDAMALADPADKIRITGQPPRRFSFAQADRAISGLAAHFVQAELPAGSIVAIQLPNTTEATLTILAAFRAGLVVALLPQLWRQAELTEALNRIGARALVTIAQIDGVDHASLALHAAVETFSIRHVCGFGDHLPDGVVPLDDIIASDRLFDEGAADHTAMTLDIAQDPRRAAVITFDVTPEGLRVVPRTQLQLIAGGLAIFLQINSPPGAAMLSAMLPTSFAGLCGSLVTWLLSGGLLSLHHPFDSDVLLTQLADDSCATLMAPAPLLLRLDAAGAFADLAMLRHVVGFWRTPEQVASSPTWRSQPDMIDLYTFGETGLFALRRDHDGMPTAITPSRTSGARSEAVASAADIMITPAGTLGLRGAMVPLLAYAATYPKPNDAALNTSAIDYVDTGYAARFDRQTESILITAPPSGVMAVGGYRFLARDLNEWAQRLAQGAMLTALPDKMSGYRLAGRAIDNGRARAALAELGLNPLMIEAFRDQTAPPVKT